MIFDLVIMLITSKNIFQLSVLFIKFFTFLVNTLINHNNQYLLLRNNLVSSFTKMYSIICSEYTKENRDISCEFK